VFARHNLRSERTKGRTVNLIGQPNDSTMELAASGSNRAAVGPARQVRKLKSEMKAET